jgi:uroporphyrinogen-III synthase
MSQSVNNLKGRVIVITRPADQCEEIGKLIREKGGIPYYFPSIETKRMLDFKSIKYFLNELQKDQVAYIIFTAANGIKYLLSAAKDVNQVNELRKGLAQTFVIAVGPSTKDSLEECQIRVDLVPEKFSSEGLIELLQERNIANKKIRIPRANNGRPLLSKRLHELGADVKEIPVYESGLPKEEKCYSFYEDIAAGRIDAIIFGSGLSAKNTFLALSKKDSLETIRNFMDNRIIIVAIGPITAAALNEIGIKVDVMPEEATFEKALLALSRYWNDQSA